MSKTFNKNIQYTFNPQITLPTSSGLTITSNSNTIGNIFTTGGNVGIGTTTPSATLDITGTLRSIGSISTNFSAPNTLQNIASINNPAILTLLAPNMPTSGTTNFFTGRALSTYNACDVQYTYAGTGSTQNSMRLGFYGQTTYNLSLLGNGNVGIGTTSPTQVLDVNGSMTLSNFNTSKLFLGNTTNGSARLNIRDVGQQLIEFQYSTSTVGNITCFTSGSGLLFNGGSGANQFVLLSSGNIGIGTPSPGESLDVRGNLRVGNNNNSNYISFYGTTGDGPGTWNHTYIGERIYNPTEQSELLLFKGNDSTTGGGADRIRLLAAEHTFDIYTSTLSGTFEGIGTSGTNVMTVNSSGTLVTGSITKTVYNSGEVIQSKCYSSAIGTSFTTSISGTYPITVSSLSFTPLSSRSYIMVSVDCTYSVGGSGSDTLQSGITIAGTTVITKTQTWYNSGTDISTTMRNNNNSLFPLMGIAPNTSTAAKTIQVLAGRVSSDDTIALSNINIEIREIQQ